MSEKAPESSESVSRQTKQENTGGRCAFGAPPFFMKAAYKRPCGRGTFGSRCASDLKQEIWADKRAARAKTEVTPQS